MSQIDDIIDEQSNRPLTVLHGLTPLEVLHGQLPDKHRAPHCYAFACS